jgi:hypothetical protein
MKKRFIIMLIIILVTTIVTYWLLNTRQIAIETVAKSYKDWEIKRAYFYGEWTVIIGKKQKTYKIFVNTFGTEIIGEPGCPCED